MLKSRISGGAFFAQANNLFGTNIASRYYSCVIKTFANKETAAAFQRLPVKRFPSDIRVREYAQSFSSFMRWLYLMIYGFRRAIGLNP
ncbi:MAG: hypothetical protein M8364_00205 [Methylobacter sp.]|uniref:hypothetical protein n=1 Tax=Methylobacter sp. TaxID=2051955 RepID=UPI002583A64B|nr:hypothetical protein [Methylobacter sp.]MCL7419315.1 hypothetical protein [Methylobacter sp.]